MTADLERLATVLDGELRSGCADTLVEGGLDELLRRQARDEPPRSPLLRMVAALPAAGYRSLEVEERRSWLRRARATIAHEQGRAAQAAKPRAPAAAARPRKRAPAASEPPPPEGAAPVRKTPQRKAPRDPVPEGEAALEWPIARAGTRLGATNLKRLERLGLNTVGDALRHYPHRYHDFSVTVPIAALRVGEEQTVRGVVDRARPVRMGRGGRMQVCEAMISDETGARLRVVWFNQPWLASQLPEGTEIALSGAVKAYRGRPTIDNPAFEKLGGEQRETGRLVPVYPSTTGLAQRTLRTTIAGLLDRFAERLPETLPPELRERHPPARHRRGDAADPLPRQQGAARRGAAPYRLRRAARDPDRRRAAQAGVALARQRPRLRRARCDRRVPRDAAVRVDRRAARRPRRHARRPRAGAADVAAAAGRRRIG